MIITATCYLLSNPASKSSPLLHGTRADRHGALAQRRLELPTAG